MSCSKNFDEVYINIDSNHCYYGYKGIVVVENEYYLRNFRTNGLIITNRKIANMFDKDEIDSHLDNTFKPNSKDPIHVVPDCKYSISDIRNNYEIKRAFDSGVCNVFSPLEYPCNTMWIDYTVAIPKIKTIVFLSSCHDSISALIRAKQYIPNIQKEDCEIFDSGSLSYIIATKKIRGYLPLLLGAAQKPCISYKKLEFNNNELTKDILTLVKKTGEKDSYEPDAIKNFTLQLAVLNQYNWREYPMTIRNLFITIPEYRTAKGEVFGCPSRYPKYVKEMCEFSKNTQVPHSEKDFNLTHDMYLELLGLRADTMFVDTVRLHEKATQTGLNLHIINQVFNLVTRITPKKYE